MKVVSRPHRADLARTEHARHSGSPETVCEMLSVVAGASEQMAAPPITRED